jgi:hypothetical protein
VTTINTTGTGRFYNTTCDTDKALLQSINAKRFRTFGEMALDFVKYQISCFQFASVVVDIFDRYDVGIGQMIHWFQSIEGLLLLALDGRSGLPNCAIFWKTLTTVPTNDFLTTCKH